MSAFLVVLKLSIRSYLSREKGVNQAVVTIKKVMTRPVQPGNDRFGCEVVPLLAQPVASLLKSVDSGYRASLEELRLRASRPLLLRCKQGEFTVTPDGKLTQDITKGLIIIPELVRSSLEIMTRSSIYAWEEELKNGFLTLPGGHRVGLAGKVIVEAGKVKTVRYVSSLNVRISRELTDIGRRILPYLIANASVHNTLIISPPQAGKTTLLRDIVRLISYGGQEAGLAGLNVGVVDERSELAGCWEGIPQNDLGPRTDVLDCCPKSQGMIMLLRAMAPQVIVTDELGKSEDIAALEEAVNGGVSVVTTVHGENEEDISRKPFLNELIRTGVFRRIVVLSRRMGVGTVEKILDTSDGKNVLPVPYLKLSPG